MDAQRWEALLRRQEELEANARADGANRFRRRIAEAEQRGEASRYGAARWLLSRAIAPVQNGIEEFLIVPTGKRKHMAAHWCDRVGADVAAYLTVKSIIDSCATRQVYRRAALDIAQLMLDEIRYRTFREKAPGLFEYAMSKFQTSNYTHMARSLSGWMRSAKCSECVKAERPRCPHLRMPELELSDDQRLLLGGKLIDIFVMTTGLAEVEHVTRPSPRKRRPTTDLYVVLKPEAEEVISKRNELLEMLNPVAMPMVVPPLPWGQREDGGYRFGLRNQFPLVRGISVHQRKVVADTAMPVVYSALNHLQNTAWKINGRVLDLVRAIEESGHAIAGIAAFEKEPLPVKPTDIDTNEEARNQYRKEAREVHDRNVERKVRANEAKLITDSAEAVEHEDAIFFPYNVDFRGRVYPIADQLHPQGRDLSKALLIFAQGKPLGETGARWLAIHGANCLDTTPQGEKVSKMTLDERVSWIERHTEEIIRVAETPFADLWWASAEDPLQFYAFCVEWTQATRSGDRGSYSCALPVALDGSCNGLQHFSAMLRDDVGGHAVNLTPSQRPADVYEQIAREVADHCASLAAEEPIAAKWLSSGLINRKLCKRPTMTFVYGSKRFGFREQLAHYLRHDLENDQWHTANAHFRDEEGKSQLWDACLFMADAIWLALADCTQAAFDGMAWMQECAGLIAAEGKAVEWKVPHTGFPVRQEYFDVKRWQIKTVLAGNIVQPSVYDTTDKVSNHEQRNGIAPNVVHSLDAAALMLTVNLAAAHGVESFAMIHDSYGAVPADCGILAQCTRREFVRLYSEIDVVADLHRQFAAQMSEEKREEFPAPPTPGCLDLSAVMASEYFFS